MADKLAEKKKASEERHEALLREVQVRGLRSGIVFITRSSTADALVDGGLAELVPSQGR
jgi:hypothetical protein